MERLERISKQKVESGQPLTWRDKVSNTLTIYGQPFRVITVAIGYLTFFFVVFYVRHTIRYLIMLRDGRLRICTFPLSGIPTKYHWFDIPLENVSFTNIKKDKANTLWIRLKGYPIPYSLDKRETFYQNELFVNRIARKRDFD